MTDLERERLLRIRLRSKRGARLTEEEFRLCQDLLARDPDGYKAVGDEVTETVKDDFRL